MGTPFYQVTGDAQEALRVFLDDLDAALAANVADPWATMVGESLTSDAIKVTYPVPVSAAGYVLREGDDKMRKLYEKSVSLMIQEYIDGVQEKAHIIEAPDFIGWLREPERIARERQRLPNTLVAAILAANPVLEFDGKALFANDHPVNLFDDSHGTFDNLHSATTVAVALPAAKTRFRKKKAPNGKPMGLRVTDVMVPPDLEEQTRDFLENSLIVQAIQEGGANVGGAAINNRHAGTVNMIVADELTEANYIYAIDRNGPPAWVVQQGSSPEEITYDKSSDRYKDSGYVGYKSVIKAVAKALLPHSIEKIQITG